MEPRMTHPVMILPEAMQGLLSVAKSVKKQGVPLTTLLFVDLRASQINGCSFCVDMHSRELKEAGEPDERIWGVGAWRESPYFNDAERAAMALTEALTRLSDRPDAVPDELWNDVRKHYDDRQTSALLIQISMINVWNRLNAAIRQVAGAYRQETAAAANG